MLLSQHLLKVYNLTQQCAQITLLSSQHNPDPLNWKDVQMLIHIHCCTKSSHHKENKIHETISIFTHLLLITSLFVLLAPEPGVGVGDLDGQLSCPLHNRLPVLGGDVVGDLSAVSPTKG